MKSILITGASGFVGKALTHALDIDGNQIIGVVRKSHSLSSSNCSQLIVENISSDTEWSDALNNVDVVIHTAARAHVLKDSSIDALEEFRKVNTAGTINLAKQAAEADVKRFVFISSIGVNGNSNSQAFTETDLPNPQEAYAVSKFEAELELLALAEHTSMEVVIIRPPLVYGPNAPGNFGNLLKWVKRGMILPLGAVHNKRSFVALDNLVDFIVYCSDARKTPKAANQLFLISDGEDVSTTQLLNKVAKAFGTSARLLSISVSVMSMCLNLIGKGAISNRLFGTLLVDSSKARELLGWQAVVTMDEQLTKIANSYLEQ